jgi:DNA-binding NarL/FixJ family response regulator
MGVSGVGKGSRGVGAVVVICLAGDSGPISAALEREGLPNRVAPRAAGGGPLEPQALEALLREVSPQLLMIDAADCRRMEAESIHRLRRTFARVQWVIGWRWPERIDIALLAHCAARGCIRWDAPVQDQVRAVRSVLGGDLWLSRQILHAVYQALVRAGPGKFTGYLPFADASASVPASIVVSADKDNGAFTVRQRQVLALVREGFSNKQIGLRLGISPNTVKKHLSIIFERQDLRSRRQLRIPPRAKAVAGAVAVMGSMTGSVTGSVTGSMTGSVTGDGPRQPMAG